MSQEEHTEEHTGEHTEEELGVVAYLRQHPEFFLRHGELLADLEIPHNSGDAISLVTRQISVLRERNEELRNRLQRLLDVARDNDHIFARTRQLVLDMLACDDADSLLTELLAGLKQHFDLDLCEIILFDLGDNVPAHCRHVALQTVREHLPALIEAPVVCGLLRLDELEFLFGERAALVGSAAVVQLQHAHIHGLLAIGHRQRDHYRSSMDTLFVHHIGEILARQLTQHCRRVPVRA